MAGHRERMDFHKVIPRQRRYRATDHAAGAVGSVSIRDTRLEASGISGEQAKGCKDRCAMLRAAADNPCGYRQQPSHRPIVLCARVEVSASCGYAAAGVLWLV
jgi:hypothetical protein